MRSHGDQSGLVGKIIVIWLLVVVLLGIVAIDATSIFLAKFRLSDAATVAAVTGATSFRNTHDVTAACEAARIAASQEEGDAIIAKNFCKVDRASGEVTVTLKKKADTLLAGRLPFTEDFTKILVRETGRPAAL
jgi:uncharacterized membrane protein